MDEKRRWIDYIPSDVYGRLANCRSVKSDILPLAKARWRFLNERYNADGKQKWQKEDALVGVLDILDCNGIYFDLTREEYDDILYQLY